MAEQNQPISPARVHFDRAVVALNVGRLDEAERECRRSLTLAPESLAAANTLGIVLVRTGRPDDAIDVFRMLLARRPDFAPALNNLGLLYRQKRRHADALACFQKLLETDPASKEAQFQLAAALVELGRTKEAIAALSETVRRDPKNAHASHMLAALRGRTTDAPPIEFVRSLFDDYAPSFEHHLVKDLAYGIPAVLRRMVGTLGPRRFARMLDVGCGTGLVAAAFADLADNMIGVDVAPNMVRAAKAKKLYAELHVMEIAAYLLRPEATGFELVAAADVFIYVGKLDALFGAVAPAMTPGGLFAFSIERAAAGDAGDFVLTPSGRYAHGARYIERLAASAGFEMAARETAVIRTGYPGEVFVLRRS